MNKLLSMINTEMHKRTRAMNLTEHAISWEGRIQTNTGMGSPRDTGDNSAFNVSFLKEAERVFVSENREHIRTMALALIKQEIDSLHTASEEWRVKLDDADEEIDV